MNEEEIFHRALDRPDPEARAAYMQQACAGNPALRAAVEALLRANVGASDFLERPTPAPAATVAEEPVTEGPGTSIGPYKLMEQIGEGGMGLVFVAEQQEPIRRKVALKVIKPGMDTRQVIARFEAERQALALMDHPNIAKVLDGGATDESSRHTPCAEADDGTRSVPATTGRPYFVMELVKGVQITEYCDQNQVPIRARLELFLDVCNAVQHAHQKGIIHRDIKPPNVLVASHDGKPVVKVIDFGIAKAIGQQLTDKTVYTQFAQLIGTPMYMSPEQAGLSSLDVDTRSDIYSLGVLLYELLTGTTPFDKERLSRVGYDEMRRIIREEEPPKPSTRISTQGQAASTAAANRKSDTRKLSQLVRGELDWIVMKALEKDRNRRYETASAFAADVQRYLNDEPVLACPPSAWYRFGKFARRNKRALATAALVGVMLLGAGGGLLWVRQDRADQAAAQARREAEIERDATLAVQEATLLEMQGKYPEALAAIRKAEGLLATGGGEELRERVGEMRADLDMLARVNDAHQQLAEPAPDTLGYDYARADRLYAQAFRDYGIDVLALEPAEAAAKIRRRAIRAALVAALYDWDWVASNKDYVTRDKGREERIWRVCQAVDTEGVLRPWWKAIQARDLATLKRQAASVQTDLLTPSVLTIMGRSLFNEGAEVEALELFRRARRQYPADFWLNHDLGVCLLRSLGVAGVGVRWDRVANRREEARLDEAVRCFTAAAALRPRDALVLVNLGGTLALQNKWAEADAVLHEAIELRPNHARAHVTLGNSLFSQKKYDAALEEINVGLRLQPDYAFAQLSRAQALQFKGETDAAIAAYEHTIKHQPKLQPGLATGAYNNLGLLYERKGLRDKAIGAFEKATNYGPKVALPHEHLGRLLFLQLGPDRVSIPGASDRAIRVLRQAVVLDPKLEKSHALLGSLLDFQNRHKEAADAFRGAIRARPNFAEAHYMLGTVYHRNPEKLDAAADALREAIHHKPGFAEAYNELGNVYCDLGKLDAAADAFQKAIRHRPKYAQAHYNLGTVFSRRDQFAQAAAAYRQAIDIQSNYASAHKNLGLALMSLGKFEEAATAYRKYINYGPKGKGHDLLDQALRAVELDRKLPAVLKREVEPAGPEERVELAQICAAKELFGAAARFSEEAFAAQPDLAADLNRGYRYAAAGAAALAAAGRGKDQPPLDDQIRTRWRKQAVAWLRADLAAWTKRLDKNTPADRAAVLRQMERWQRDADLAAIREEVAVANLPRAEGEACRKLWTGVAELLKRVKPVAKEVPPDKR
jgi:serine/threonine protein kinase/Tfp pilus assembly protein PilF